MDKFTKRYINNQLIDVVNKSYINYLEIKKTYTQKELNCIANVIAITSINYWSYGKDLWLNKFKHEKLVLNKIIETNDIRRDNS